MIISNRFRGFLGIPCISLRTGLLLFFALNVVSAVPKFFDLASFAGALKIIIGMMDLAFGMAGLVAVASGDRRQTKVVYHSYKVLLVLRLCLDGYILSNFVLLMRDPEISPEDRRAMAYTAIMIGVYFCFEYGFTWHVLSSMKSLAAIFAVGGTGSEKRSALQLEAEMESQVSPKMTLSRARSASHGYLIDI
ncbi:MAG: uncharacterized protein KVP18_003567 [Porospora cf. gigantea A]|uniref:uncharacterized protein n=1 Tax=Porospora cf. gigantea A TaxID=2853593 RepID=UPI00355A43DC|nr:MAG: hypothetical protein KVP18_003567 [Porospora cf. gigantea A]